MAYADDLANSDGGRQSLSDKLDLIINSHAGIIARLDGIQQEIERCIMQRINIDIIEEKKNGF
jgi:hypothetical protein